jgi:hypothetical protein
MSHKEIRPVDRSCKSYRPGHQVNWMQAGKAVQEEQPVIDVSIVIHDDGRVDLEGDELHVTMWHHDPDRLQSAWDYWGGGVWKPRYHVVSLPGLFRHVVNLAARDGRTPCTPGVYYGRFARRDRGPLLACCGQRANITASHCGVEAQTGL